MSKSHTKHYKICNHYCKKGNSKIEKVRANRKVRRILKTQFCDYILKGSFYKKFTDWWIIQGDYGIKPASLNYDLKFEYYWAGLHGLLPDVEKVKRQFLKDCYYK